VCCVKCGKIHCKTLVVSVFYVKFFTSLNSEENKAERCRSVNAPRTFPASFVLAYEHTVRYALATKLLP
jgi:hypothetical protein